MRAIIAKRSLESPLETDEIQALAERAGYTVVGERTQVRAEHAESNLGPGALSDVAALAEEHTAGVVIVDGTLTPKQALAIQRSVPDAVEVKDRRRVILDVFRQGAGTRQARLQVRLAELKHELPRVRAAIRRDEANEITSHDEEGRQVEDIKRQIDDIRQRLADTDDVSTASRTERRREAGLDLAVLVGYTNAGKTTLLRRLADDLSLCTDSHRDLAETAAVDDRLFETLGTTTRRMTVDGRRLLLTDTVGFIRDLPHELIAAFRSSLSAVSRADVIVLVVDGSDPPDQIHEKVTTVQDALSDDGELDPDGTLIPVVNKVDRLDSEAVESRCDVVAPVGDPITVSATDGTNVDRLRQRLRGALPARDATVVLPNCSESMRFISWVYDNMAVEDVTYDGSTVEVRFTGRPQTVERALAKAADIE